MEWIEHTRMYISSFNIKVLMECGESGEDASVNANRILRNRGPIWTDGRRPEVRIGPQFRRMRFAFTDVPEPDSPHLHCY